MILGSNFMGALGPPSSSSASALPTVFRQRSKGNRRHAEGEYTRHRGICIPTGRNAELELGGPRTGHLTTADAELELGGPRGRENDQRLQNCGPLRPPLAVVEHDPIAGLPGSEVVHGFVDLAHREVLGHRLDPVPGAELQHRCGGGRRAEG